MIQQTTLFNGFIRSLPKEVIVAEPEQEGKRTNEKLGCQFQEFSRFQDWMPPRPTIRRGDVLSQA
jgi:hypothetical protein